MSRGRHDQYSKAEVAIRGLACPFVEAGSEAHMSIDGCKPEEGFKETRLLLEHIWRKHTRFFRCGFCPKRWSVSKSRKEVTEKKEEHWESCDGKRRHVIYYEESEANGSDLLLNWKQQELLEQIKSTRDVKAKLKALYELCGKPVPETYYATAPPLAVQPQMPYGAPGEQPPRQAGDFFGGFVRPPAETPRPPPRKRPTISNVSKIDAALQAGDSSEVSGYNRSKDQDSGYASGPRNQGDVDDFPPTNGPPAQTYWSYEEGGNHVATASPGRLTNDEGSFASIHNDAGRGEFQAYDHVDPALYGDVSSLTRGNDALFDMNLPNSGAGSVGEPLDLSNITDLEAEFLEY